MYGIIQADASVNPIYRYLQFRVDRQICDRVDKFRLGLTIHDCQLHRSNEAKRRKSKKRNRVISDSARGIVCRYLCCIGVPHLHWDSSRIGKISTQKVTNRFELMLWLSAISRYIVSQQYKHAYHGFQFISNISMRMLACNCFVLMVNASLRPSCEFLMEAWGCASMCL